MIHHHVNQSCVDLGMCKLHEKVHNGLRILRTAFPGLCSKATKHTTGDVLLDSMQKQNLPLNDVMGALAHHIFLAFARQRGSNLSRSIRFA